MYAPPRRAEIVMRISNSGHLRAKLSMLQARYDNGACSGPIYPPTPEKLGEGVQAVMMRMTIGVVFAVAFTISGAARDFIAQSGAPAAAFPKPDRPVADIVSPIWHDEKERDDAGEPGQLVRLLGIKSGMTVADIGAGSG